MHSPLLCNSCISPCITALQCIRLAFHNYTGNKLWSASSFCERPQICLLASVGFMMQNASVLKSSECVEEHGEQDSPLVKRPRRRAEKFEEDDELQPSPNSQKKRRTARNHSVRSSSDIKIAWQSLLCLHADRLSY